MGEEVVMLRRQVDHIDRWELLLNQMLPAKHHNVAWLVLTSMRRLLLLLVNNTLVITTKNCRSIVRVR